MKELSGAQTRQLIDCEQVYATLRQANREYALRFSGSMAWKMVGGRRYLYRKRDGNWKSLGPEDVATKLAYEQFHTGRDALKARRTSLDDEIRVMAPINRAMGLGRVPWTSARVLRRLDRIGALGHGLRVAGTHALFAYERMGGVHFSENAVTTIDIDLLYDARTRLDFLAPDTAESGLMGVLRSVDRSFVATAAGSFRAANDKGFMVDLITPATRHPARMAARSRLSDDSADLTPVEIEGLSWLESSPAIEATAIDERGFPVTIVAPDPRAFVCHKLWLVGRDDRDPLKRRRDLAQAREVANMIVTHQLGAGFDDPALAALPADVRKLGESLADSLSQIGQDRRDSTDWT